MSIRRVLFLVPDLRNPDFKGGIQVFNAYVLRALEELGIDVTVIGVNDRPEDKVPGLIPCNRGPRARKILSGLHLARRVWLHRPDLVICGHLNYASMCRRVCRSARVPYITITHGIELLWDMAPSKIRGAMAGQRVLAVSRHTRSLNLDLLKGYDPDKVVVFPNTFDEERFKPAPESEAFRSQLGLAPEHRMVLTVGRLSSGERLKGYDEVIEAMARVCQEIPEARYVLAGRGDDMDRLRDLAQESGLGDRLIMPGFVAEEDIVPMFNSCDLFVLASRKEGFGIVFLEAMGCGKPVIGGNQDGSMEPLCDGTLGTAVDPEDVDAVAGAILDHLQGRVPATRSDPEHLRREVVERFGFDRFRERLQGVLESL